MRKIYLLMLLAGLFVVGKAQTFHVTPSNTVNTTLDVNHSVDVYIHFTNNFQTPIDLVWEVTSANNSYPSQWFMTVCDNASCYTLPHPIDSMAPVAAQDSGFLKMTCVPSGFAGSGSVSFRVYDMNSPTSSANVTFNFEATTFVAVDPSALDQQFAVSPNPASDYVRLSGRGGLLDKGTVSILDLQGKVVRTQEISAVQSVDFSVADLAPGMYSLRYASKGGTLTKKVVVAH